MNPVIGIVMCGSENGRQFISQPYLDAIEHAGGVPVLLPVVENTALFEDFYRLCDGWLFCGGGDITPLLFGEELLTDQGETDLATDLFHLSLMRYALDSHLPLLAICRGMQVMNIALGGTIYQNSFPPPVPYSAAYADFQGSPGSKSWHIHLTRKSFMPVSRNLLQSEQLSSSVSPSHSLLPEACRHCIRRGGGSRRTCLSSVRSGRAMAPGSLVAV